MKPVTFLGTSRSDLRGFPPTVRKIAGLALFAVQQGDEPDDWKPMPDVGPGVRELRVRDAAGAFRFIYVATRAEAVYVLHVFQKRTRQTAQRDLDLAKARLRDLVRSKP